MKLTTHETALITYIRTLCFDDMLDASSAIYAEAEKAKVKSIVGKHENDKLAFVGFKERQERLDKLAELLGGANEDYRAHIFPDEPEQPAFLDADQLKTKIKELVGTITFDSKPITFAEFLSEMAGSGELFNMFTEDVLDTMVNPNAFWGDVDDYMAPIAHQVLNEASELDRDLYLSLAKTIQHAYQHLKVRHEAEIEAERDEPGKEE
ncbi:hypothetical protein SAMN02799630_01194 [Paenibacillus sp. UNCCL117]|uniref:hypothetical protein n=1 Tax=unclassified Paenibacillus TaxID=185978 RepID=UPI00088E5ADA|nr:MULTISPECIES: hypothetical protein [unclassified Paenibacillus]SDC69071.1 hypothetical protein SAMN04488602_103172 [Paenibacillus sp. cl123]SFW23805.1 hypothetical protein SAMN02799630_01194 [Paenibacillus sp. UNCCL117]